MNSLLLEKEKRYPNSARRMGLEGQVFINVKLDSLGAIRSYRLAGGLMPVMLHLLSPAGSPVQITDDLRRFWAGAYEQVRA